MNSRCLMRFSSPAMREPDRKIEGDLKMKCKGLTFRHYKRQKGEKEMKRSMKVTFFLTLVAAITIVVRFSGCVAGQAGGQHADPA